MTRFDKAQLITFIRAIDRNLTSKVKIVVIGGAAAALGYDSATRTSDVDVFNVMVGSSDSLSEATDLARRQTGLAVSVSGAAVADLPANYEDRLKSIRGLQLKNLTIVVPDKYDLVLSKTVRGYPHDIEAIEGINAQHPLSKRTLIERFVKDLMNQAVSDPRKVALNMAIVVARLYGFDEGRKVAEQLGVPVPPQG